MHGDVKDHDTPRDVISWRFCGLFRRQFLITEDCLKPELRLSTAGACRLLLSESQTPAAICKVSGIRHAREQGQTPYLLAAAGAEVERAQGLLLWPRPRAAQLILAHIHHEPP